MTGNPSHLTTVEHLRSPHTFLLGVFPDSTPSGLSPLLLGLESLKIVWGCGSSHADKDLGATKLASYNVCRPRDRVLVAQTLHLLNVRGRHVVVGVSARVSGCGRELALDGRRNGRPGSVTETSNGGASSIVGREEDEWGVERRGLGSGRVIDDRVGGRERSSTIGKERFVRRNLKRPLRTGCRLVTAAGDQGETGSEQPSSWSDESSKLHCGRWEHREEGVEDGVTELN